LSNSVSPLLSEIDVQSHPNSILTLEFDEVSDIVFHMGRIWFMWHMRPKTLERNEHPNSPGRFGLASVEIDETGKLANLRKWPLPIPPQALAKTAKFKSAEFQIATIAGSDLICLIHLKHDGPNYWGAADCVPFSFSPTKEIWSIGAYGSATKKFRFHPIEKPQDISAEIFNGAKLTDTILLYTEDDKVCGFFDNTQTGTDNWERSAETAKLLDDIFYQKMELLEPNAAAFIYLNNGVPYDQQISEPAGGKTIFFPAFDKRVVLLHNYEPSIKATDPVFSNPTNVNFRFKWPGLAIERDDDFDVAFAVTHNMGARWNTAVINMRLPITLLNTSSMIHNCGKDIFGCVTGFCRSTD